MSETPELDTLPVFMRRVREEIEANVPQKGPWEDWKPTSMAEILNELDHHTVKAHNAALEGNVSLLQEYAADMATYGFKIWYQAAALCAANCPVDPAVHPAEAAVCEPSLPAAGTSPTGT